MRSQQKKMLHARRPLRSRRSSNPFRLLVVKVARPAEAIKLLGETAASIVTRLSCPTQRSDDVVEKSLLKRLPKIYTANP